MAGSICARAAGAARDSAPRLISRAGSEEWRIAGRQSRPTVWSPLHWRVNPSLPYPAGDNSRRGPAEAWPLSAEADAVGAGQVSHTKPSSWFPVRGHWWRASRPRSRQPWLRRRVGGLTPDGAWPQALSEGAGQGSRKHQSPQASRGSWRIHGQTAPSALPGASAGQHRGPYWRFNRRPWPPPWSSPGRIPGRESGWDRRTRCAASGRFP